MDHIVDNSSLSGVNDSLEDVDSDEVEMSSNALGSQFEFAQDLAHPAMRMNAQDNMNDD